MQLQETWESDHLAGGSVTTWCGLMTPWSLLLPHHEHSILTQNDSLMLESS